jgi:hypothetical protein
MTPSRRSTVIALSAAKALPLMELYEEAGKLFAK